MQHGGAKDPMKMLCGMLNGNPTMDCFLKEIGILKNDSHSKSHVEVMFPKSESNRHH